MISNTTYCAGLVCVKRRAVRDEPRYILLWMADISGLPSFMMIISPSSMQSVGTASSSAAAISGKASVMMERRLFLRTTLRLLMDARQRIPSNFGSNNHPHRKMVSRKQRASAEPDLHAETWELFPGCQDPPGMNGRSYTP